MPAGIPVATVAIGKAGSINAGLLAASILGIKYPQINKKILDYRKKQTKRVLRKLQKFSNEDCYFWCWSTRNDDDSV